MFDAEEVLLYTIRNVSIANFTENNAKSKILRR